MRRSLTRLERIRKKSEFDNIFSIGKRKIYCDLKFLFIRNNLPINRIGVIIKRGVKNAVQRNREKRLVLEAYRYLKPDIVQGHDFLVIVLKIGSSYSERSQQLEYFFRSFNLIKS